MQRRAYTLTSILITTAFIAISLLVHAWGRLSIRHSAIGQVPRWEPVEAAAFPIELPKGEHIDTGYVIVLEDRAKPEGRTIRLPVAIVRSRSATPAPDPVVYTAGGPGSSSLSAAQYGGAYRFTDTRDLIVFEQRGTRYAVPALTCPEVTESKTEGTLRSLDAAGRAALDANAAAVCRARFAASGINLAAYTTAASAADLEDLRCVLGIQKWNLYGTSYSTRLMLAVLRAYPVSVRSAVLDSPLPPSERYDSTSVAHLNRSLNKVLRDCAAQPACNMAYPNLRARFYTSLAAANRSPLIVTVHRPGDSKEVQVNLRAADLVNLVDTGDTWALPGLPRRMDQIARRDSVALREAVERTLRPKNYAWGMRYSVWCGEETQTASPRKSPSGVGGRSPELGITSLDLSPAPAEVCKAWDVPPVSKTSVPLIQRMVPTLLIVGEYDPYTPLASAKAVARTLPKSRILTFRNMGHVPTQVWDQPCAMAVAAAFVESPDSDPVKSSAGVCLKDPSNCRAPTFQSEKRQREQ